MVLLRTQLQHLGVLRRRMSRLLARNHAKAAALTRVLSRSGDRDAIAAQGAVAKVGDAKAVATASVCLHDRDTDIRIGALAVLGSASQKGEGWLLPTPTIRG